MISIRHLDARDQLLLPKVDLEPDRLAALLDLRIITGIRKRKLIKCFRSSSLYKFHFCEMMISTSYCKFYVTKVGVVVISQGIREDTQLCFCSTLNWSCFPWHPLTQIQTRIIL